MTDTLLINALYHEPKLKARFDTLTREQKELVLKLAMGKYDPAEMQKILKKARRHKEAK